MNIRIDRIVVDERRREDYGDLDDLAANIVKHGLLHPIVVDDADRLVAGARRLRACQQLGWTSIAATRLEGLTDLQRREIELDENLHRKDLTPIEASRTLVALVETAREIAQDEKELRAIVARNSGPGRPTELGSLRNVADRIGSKESTIRRAAQHVAIVDEHPDLETLPQAQALKIAKQRDEQAEQDASDAAFATVLRVVPGAADRMRKLTIRRQFINGRASTTTLLLPLNTDVLVDTLEADDLEDTARFIRRSRDWFDALETSMQRGIRLVDGKD